MPRFAGRTSAVVAAAGASGALAQGLEPGDAFAVPHGSALLRGGNAPAARPETHFASVQQAAAVGQRASPSSAAPVAGGLLALGAATVAAAAAAQRQRRSGARRQQRGRRSDIVAVRDGSSWGSLDVGASSSLDTSGALPCVKLTRGTAEATVYLHGACVTSYKTDGTEWLACRPDAKFDGSKPISGGLPICWPQFGNGEIQQHGFARNMSWRLLEEPSDAGTCVLELVDTEETREMWPHNFRVEYRVDLKEDRLSTTFTVFNTSNSAFDFTGALHSYYSVFNIDACSVWGDFKGATILDKTQDPVAMGTSGSETVTIVKPTETIYKEVLPGNYAVEDPSKGSLVIENDGGWRDVMIWNPYGNEQMGYETFICAESVATSPQTLAANGTWVATMDLVPKPNA